MGNSHLIRVEKGRGGATWGHWQIGLAYARLALAASLIVASGWLARLARRALPAP